ncbi:MAG TPA: FeoA family protein [Pyrinomonadaceae bacterium]|nr:FeoA family protein [Pyrinomonadaceae bacterium]
MEIAENINAFMGRTTEQISNVPRSLDILPIGATARVTGVSGSGAIARRLIEMGVVPGAPVRVIKAAPLGDPIEVRVRNYHLALRRTEAKTISVASDE